MLKMTPSVVLSRPSPCNVPQGYASVAELPAALPGTRRVPARQGWVGEKSGHFEHPAVVLSSCPRPANHRSSGVRNGFSAA